jgi:hypothetical protein
MNSLQEWINAALRVADAEGMANEEVIPTWPVDCVERFPDRFPQLTVGALREWQARPKFTALCQSKARQIGSPVGLLARNEAGGLAAVHNLGRVTWLDDCVARPVEQEARTQKATVLEAERWKNIAHDQAETISELQGLVHFQRQASAQDGGEPVAGEMVSIDVSTCDEDNGNRVFGEIIDWQDDGDGRRIWLCSLDHYNYSRSPSALVPKGWKLVPIKPTGRMLKHGTMARTISESGSDGVYKSMIEAAPSPPSAVVPEWMHGISENIKTQNNRITADPLFVVFQKRAIVVDEDYDYDRISWGNSDGEADDEVQNQLNAYYDDSESDFWGSDEIEFFDVDTGIEVFRRFALKEVDEFVTACFTEVGANDYLMANGHNLNQPLIFVTSLYRNEEMKRLRGWLMQPPQQEVIGDE